MSSSNLQKFPIRSRQPYISPDAGRAPMRLGTFVRNPSYVLADFRFEFHLPFGPD